MWFRPCGNGSNDEGPHQSSGRVCISSNAPRVVVELQQVAQEILVHTGQYAAPTANTA